MKILLNEFTAPEFIGLADRLYQSYDIERCDMLCGARFSPAWPKMDVFPFSELLSGNYDVNWGTLISLGRDLISAMQGCETEVMRMMDRHYPVINSDYTTRKRIYLRHLQFWNDRIERMKYDIFISISLPHETIDFIIYHLMKFHGIPVIILIQSMIPNKYYLVDDINFPDDFFKEVNNARPVETSEDPEIEQYIDRMLVREGDNLPFYMPPLVKNKSYNGTKLKSPLLMTFVRILGAFRYVFHPRTFLHQLYCRVTGQEAIDDLVMSAYGIYRENSVIPDLGMKYVYLALATQPESSTSPCAGVFVDQVLIVSMLRRGLPDDVYIYIKEHPYQPHIKYGKTKTKEFYRDLLGFDKVVFVDIDFSSYTLIEHAVAVCTPSGSVGWEALFYSKPVLLFGYNFYRGAPGVYHISEFRDCEKAVEEIFFEKVRTDIGELKRFIRSLDIHSCKGYVDISYQKGSNMGYTENLEVLWGYISSRMNQIFNKA